MPLFLPPAITAFGGSEGYFSLAIIASGAFGFIAPKLLSLEKNGQEEPGRRNLRRLRSSREGFGVGFRWVVEGGFPVESEGKGGGGGEGGVWGGDRQRNRQVNANAFVKIVL